MRVKITAGGIYGNDGEIPIGTTLDVKDEPTAWAGRYEVISGDDEGKEAVTNPADPAPSAYSIKEKGAGWYAIVDAQGEEVGKALRKDDAEAFEALTDQDKADFAAEHAKG